MIKVLHVLVVLTTLVICGSSCAQHQNKDTGMTDTMNTNGILTDTATFGTGCFWCTEAVFQQLRGVLKVTSGYSGGHVVNPTYEQICNKNTGHAEVIRIVYDPAQITYDELLEVFWQTHDPTTLNKQGNDVGPQYRSVVFYHNEEQRKKTAHYKAELDQSGSWNDKIVTAIEPYKNFYAAENYHQNYYNNNGAQPYCYFVVRPKVETFQKVFKGKLRTQ